MTGSWAYNDGVSRDVEPIDAAEGAPTRQVGADATDLRALRGLLWALVVVIAAAWLFLGGGLEAVRGTVGATRPTTAAEIGQSAPELRLPLATGGEVRLDNYRGKVLVLNFWATWCAPCRAEMPAIEYVYRTHRERGLEVLAVDLQERDDEVLAFLSDVGASFPSAIDATGETTRRYRANALPTTFLIDRQGVIRDVRVGPYTEQMLEERLAALL
jgi:peroxiredoxin